MYIKFENERKKSVHPFSHNPGCWDGCEHEQLVGQHKLAKQCGRESVDVWMYFNGREEGPQRGPIGVQEGK